MSDPPPDFTPSNPNRLDRIEQMLADDPGDRFLRYSLAMEHRGAGNTDAALENFDRLITADPPHVPAYFMSAQMLADIDRVDEARERLRNGIDQARTQGDTHAAAEMSELLASLGSLGEL